MKCFKYLSIALLTVACASTHKTDAMLYKAATRIAPLAQQQAACLVRTYGPSFKNPRLFSRTKEVAQWASTTLAWGKTRPSYYMDQVNQKVNPLKLSFLEKMAHGSRRCVNYLRRQQYAFEKSALKTQKQIKLDKKRTSKK